MSQTTLPLSAQLYTIRDLTANDFAYAVREVARIGYAAVELAGYGNLTSAADVKKACDDAGLKISGNHVAIESLEEDPARVADENAVFGIKQLIVPWVVEGRRKDAAGWHGIARSLNVIGAQLRDRGYELLYHNHSFEFQQFDGKTGMDILLENTDPALVKCELDVYWVAHGGHDPAGYINRLGPRCALLHMKDMAPGPDRQFAAVGTGTLDFPAIVAAARRAGVEWYVAEQDNCYGRNPLDSLRTSFENLKKLMGG